MKNKVLSNAFWLIGMQIIRAIIAFFISMLTARYLGPSNYGTINYAASLVSFLSPVMYLGFNSVLVQELIENPNQEGKVLGTTIGYSLISSLICILGIYCFVSIANKGEYETQIVCLLYSTLLLFQSMDLIQYWFQAKLLAKYSSVVTLVAYLVVSLYKFYLLLSNKNIYWFSLSMAFEYALVSLLLIVVYKKLNGQQLKFSIKLGTKILQKSRYYIVSSMMVAISTQIDRVMLKVMINEAATGYYSVAVTCASMTSFVFVAIIDSFRPVIFEEKIKNETEYRNNLRMLYSIEFYLSLLQSIVISIFAPMIIRIIYGIDYLQSIPILRIVVWYTTFSYFGAIRNIWILAEKKQRYLWIINVCSALVNIITNAFFIPIWGVCGAAVASLISNFITIVLIGYIIQPIRENNVIMKEAMNPLFLLRSTKSLMDTLLRKRNNKM